VKLEDLLHRLVRECVQQELRGLTIAGAPSSPANDLDHTRDSPMTTAQAARYCGFKTTAAIRKALLDGRLMPLGRRGGTGRICGRGRRSTRFWPVRAVVSSRSDVQVRLRPTSEDIMEGTKWVERWKFWIAPKPSRPGVWRLRGGGYLVRGRATDFRTGKKREILRTVKDTDAAGAYKQPAGGARRGPQRGGETSISADALQRIRRIAVRKKGAQG
jgi:hypothetical protein